jgi:hypothetical protein
LFNRALAGGPRTPPNADRLSNEAGSPHARYAIATRRGARWTVELVVLEYDWSEVVTQAQRNRRPDWAQAFLAT